MRRSPGDRMSTVMSNCDYAAKAKSLGELLSNLKVPRSRMPAKLMLLGT
jgi:hypothetical protein